MYHCTILNKINLFKQKEKKEMISNIILQIIDSCSLYDMWNSYQLNPYILPIAKNSNSYTVENDNNK